MKWIDARFRLKQQWDKRFRYRTITAIKRLRRCICIAQYNTQWVTEDRELRTSERASKRTQIHREHNRTTHSSRNNSNEVRETQRENMSTFRHTHKRSHRMWWETEIKIDRKRIIQCDYRRRSERNWLNSFLQIEFNRQWELSNIFLSVK